MNRVFSLFALAAFALCLAAPDSTADESATVEIAVPEMKCAGCAWAVTNQLKKLPDVSDVYVDHVSKKAVIAVASPDSPGKEAIAAAVKATGYSVTSYRHLDIAFTEAKSRIATKR